ncbi:MAG: hypothetical protein IJZ53_06205 [Tyzzerella sp.]|nr:hypothetical protein [Tyzzerella sp.]
MNGFSFKRQSVEEAHFVEHSEIEKKKNIEVGVEGGILIPKDFSKDRTVAVKLNFHFGQEGDRIVFTLKTTTVFDVDESLGNDIADSKVESECLPITLAQLRKTVKNVSEAYGRGPIDLPPFDEENNE